MTSVSFNEILGVFPPVELKPPLAPTEVTVPVLLVKLESLLNSEMLIEPFARSFCTLDEFTTAKQAPSLFVVESFTSPRLRQRVTSSESPPPIRPAPAATQVISP